MRRSARLRTLLGPVTLAASLGLGLSGCGSSPAPAVPRSAASHLTAQDSVALRLGELERSYKGRVGAFALDTGSGRAVAYRAAERFPFTSTFKAMACGAILRKARRSDPGLLDRRLRWTKDDLLPNSPVTGEHVEDGLTVAELCHAAVTRSDNTAANVLLGQIGGPAGLTRFLRSLNDPVSRLDRYETDLNLWRPGQERDTTTPATVGRDLAALTTGRALAPPDRARLDGWLRASTTGGARIRAGVPRGWAVGDKTGTGSTYGTAADIAVVTPPHHAPLIIAIYTNRDDAQGQADESVIARTTSILVDGLGPIR
ncbi:class A beta-lactamase [Actinomadura graeca]|uniref:Beta-lactamase n=1 Tax=Actinomadura graeca TaxID=2750812 RepID=A0ABX8QYL2_9ACTN|nr:class A beta-lactamase [Actinomadura graeca]QXJ21863.1 class A beta-lactamase [Actinomadura graeca]